MPRRTAAVQVAEVPPAEPVIKRTVTETRTEAVPAAPVVDEPKEQLTLSEWYAQNQDHLDDYLIYLYRRDRDVKTIAGQLKLSARLLPPGQAAEMLEPGKTEDPQRARYALTQLEQGDFRGALTEWIQAKFGGGLWELQINIRKTGDGARHEKIETLGEPILTAREQWAPGASRPAGGGVAAVEATELQKLAVDVLRGRVQEAEKKGESTVGWEKMLDLVQNASSQNIRALIDMMPKQGNILEQINGLLPILERFGAFGKSGPSESESFDRAVDRLTKLGLLHAPTAPADPLDTITKTVTAFNQLKGLAPAAAAVAGDEVGFWGAIAPVLPQILPDLRAMVTEVVGAVKMRLSMAQPSRAAAVVPGVSGALRMNPTAAPATAPAASGVTPIRPSQPQGNAPAAPAPIRPSQPPAAAAPTVETAPADAPVLTPQIAAEVIEAWQAQFIVAKIQSGATGQEVADWLVFTDKSKAETLASFTPQQIMEYMQKHPLFCQVAAHPRLPTFIQEYLEAFE